MNILQQYKHFIQQRQQQQLYRTWRTYQSVGVTRVQDDAGNILQQFASNNYLGLSHHPVLQQAAQQALQRYGVGSPASRVICGQTPLLRDAEQQLANFLKYDEVLIFPSGYQMCAGVVAALADASVVGKPAVITADKSCHASLYMGVQQAGGVLKRYAHRHRAGAQKHLPQSDLWLTEGVFSMDGDALTQQKFWHNTAPLAHQHGVLSVVDDAHGFGVLGSAGRGTLADELYQPQVLLGTFSKAIGCMGGFVACNRDIADYLRQKCAALIYTTVLPPAVLGAVAAAIELLPQLDAQRQQLHTYAQQLRASIVQRGDSVGCSHTHIVTWMMPSIAAAQHAWQYLYDHGFLVACVRPPTVAQPLLRICPSAAHTTLQIEQLNKFIIEYKSPF